MPEVKVDLTIDAPIETVWDTVVDVERYQQTMDTVRSVKLVGRSDGQVRRAAWSVLLKGSILQWEEEEHLDLQAHRIEFRQLRGDLEHFDGRWALDQVDDGRTTVLFEVAFEIGIPLLADMLNPVAQRSLTENCTEMLRGIERRSSVV